MAGLRKYVDYLKQCNTAKRSFNSLRILDDESENAEMARKLPVWLSRQWSRRAAAYREATGEVPAFSEFVGFLSQEERLANDPLARSLQRTEGTKERSRGVSFVSESRGTSATPETHSDMGAGRNFGTCVFCKDKHSIQICKKFGAEAFESRLRYIRENRLCFSCLTRGHLSRECRNKWVCQICQGGHPTSMH